MGDYKISLKAARVNANLTQTEVAKTLNVTVKTIINWETGETQPDMKKTKMLCQLYNCPFEALSI